ncbi:putative anthranilate phosphoribosyltransferase [Phaeomoniella chlamydospora]|uniref:Putative anthranilate phosphoribosyltransferase n=1 Tax=Phaeomoniella chlamydospora TaxID=158046 RepID=A0A0G2EXY5_PHACM|nr:putative anthranilate phosphoribosyltransferase [Phaeomoniella chlamydospora]
MANRPSASTTEVQPPEEISIAPLLKRIAYPHHSQIDCTASEIASAFALIFENRVSQVQFAAFLTLLHSTRLDKDPDVLSQCAQRMREAASQVDELELREAMKRRARKSGTYKGGFCDIVGTGGDSHSTFNISTTSSIISSAFLTVAKHGNRAQTSLSGSADVLNAIVPTSPNISAVNANNLHRVFADTNYSFLFAPNFHPGMKYAAPLRRGLGIRTIFNLLGPLANPVDWAIEARLVGVAYQELGPLFASALKLSGSKKALIVCGEEDLDEISCAGRTNCWMLREVKNPDSKGASDVEDGEDETSDEDSPPRTICEVETFSLHPNDFGLPTHPLSEVHGGRLPEENAKMLMKILRNELPEDDPILHFVLLNTAAFLAISGICEADTCETGEVVKERGPGGMRWKEGLRRARWCITSGKALEQLEKFIEVSQKI